MDTPSIDESYNKGRAEGYRWLEIAFDCWNCMFEHKFHRGDTPPPFDTSATWNTRMVIDLAKEYDEDHRWPDLYA